MTPLSYAIGLTLAMLFMACVGTIIRLIINGLEGRYFE